MKKLLALVLAITGTGFLIASAPTTYAATCGSVKTSIDFGCKSTGSGVQATPVFALLLAVVNFLAIGVGIVVVGGILWGAFQYITANGNSGKTEQAMNIVVNSVIGLFVYAFLFAIVNYLVPGGLFH